MISPLEHHLARSLVRAAVKRAERECPGDEAAQNLQVGEDLMQAITAAIESHERAQRPSNVVNIRQGARK